ncbi:tetratricopeptide repeat protein [Variovorax terrae]|uniref:Tetratricopeptide repeat protein n=1 Tax=Variovorax terrae TaxID=2923278 RepID=A0A9X2AR97_9BURK|nr:tetratricopeptide repeat protein [Variovorax terrae]MCJ0765427.1 tetratricopeptide repeat protein [Variovorax terrae]
MIGTWKLATLAFSAEVASLALLDRDSSELVLAGYFALHALASALSAGLAWTLLPAPYRQPRVPAFALLFCFGFFIPGLGVVATVLTVQIAQRFPKILRTERYVQVAMPEFSTVQQEATARSDLRAGDARHILKDHSLPLETRLRVLVALQSMRPKAAVPLLQGLLSDPSEDIRLLAYSMVDAWEKDLSEQIRSTQLRLQAARQQDDRAPLVNALQRLAELHWQQADTGLARGDLRRFALQQAQKHCEDVLMLEAHAPGTWRLYARVLIELDQLAAAARALSLARKLRMPPAQVWPLMAHIAYLRRDYDGVRKYIGRLPPDAQLPHQWRGVAAYWRQYRIAGVDLHV